MSSPNHNLRDCDIAILRQILQRKLTGLPHEAQSRRLWPPMKDGKPMSRVEEPMSRDEKAEKLMSRDELLQTIINGNIDVTMHPFTWYLAIPCSLLPKQC
jgi:hypothetical protein